MHRLQERRLGFGGSAVDLVGQQHVAEDRPWLEFETRAFPVLDKHRRAGHVGGHQVRGELDAAELELGRLAKGAHQARLAKPWRTFDQHVPLRQHRHEQVFDHPLLA